jgi:hypothetical protein
MSGSSVKAERLLGADGNYFMNNLSPNDPLYWFKNLPKELSILVQLDDKRLMELPKHYKFRMIGVNEELISHCEVVGGANCGLRFYLSGNGINAMEPVSD